MNIELKDEAKEILQAEARLLAGVVQRNPGTTNAMRVDLRLPQLGLGPTPIGAPTDAPIMEFVECNGWKVKLQIRRPGAEGKGKGPKISGANIYSFIGPAAPSDPLEYKFEGDTSKNLFEVAFPDVPAGTKVWITCCFKSPRFQTGPACAPQAVIIGGGVPETLVG